MRKIQKCIAVIGLLSILLTGCTKQDSEKDLIQKNETSTVCGNICIDILEECGIL